MEDEENCGNCIFWKDRSPSGDAEAPCKRFPPVLNVVQLRQDLKEAMGRRDVIEATNNMVPWYFPTTTWDDWCGEWKARKEADQGEDAPGPAPDMARQQQKNG